MEGKINNNVQKQSTVGNREIRPPQSMRYHSVSKRNAKPLNQDATGFNSPTGECCLVVILLTISCAQDTRTSEEMHSKAGVVAAKSGPCIAADMHSATSTGIGTETRSQISINCIEAPLKSRVALVLSLLAEKGIAS